MIPSSNQTSNDPSNIGIGQCPIHHHQQHHHSARASPIMLMMDGGNQQGGRNSGNNMFTCDNSCSCGSGGRKSTPNNPQQQQQQSSSTSSSLSMDRAAFLLIRIKRVFQKKRKKNQAIKSAKLNAMNNSTNNGGKKQKPPMLRARTLPAIITPALNILQAQLQHQQQLQQQQQQHQQQQQLQNQMVNINVKEDPTTVEDGQQQQTSFPVSNRADSFEPLTGCYYRNTDFLPFATQTTAANCNCPNCTNGQTYSPRHSVSSNSSGGSQKETSSATTTTAYNISGSVAGGRTKNSSFQKLTKLWSNNSNRILNTTNTYGVGFWCKSGGGGGGGGNHVPSSSFNQDWMVQDNRPRLSWNMAPDQQPTPTLHYQTKDISSNNSNPNHHHHHNNNNNQMKRSGSIDSLMEAHQMQNDWQEWQDSLLGTIDCDPIPSIITTTIDPPSNIHYLQPSSIKSGTIKSRLSISGPGTKWSNIQDNLDGNSMNSAAHQESTAAVGFGLKKSERKKLEKLSKFNFDQQALFLAVENEHLERTRMIIESANVDLNSLNSDGFTILDISLMLLNLPMIKYLQSRGAREGEPFCTRQSRESHLQSLLNEAQHCLLDLTICLQRQLINIHEPISSGKDVQGGLITSTTTGGGVLSSALVKEKERQLLFWQRRLKLLQRFKKGFDLLQIPPPPLSVHVQVAGADSLLVHYYPPIRLQDRRNIITKYKIEWSMDQFETVLGYIEMVNVSIKHELTIDNLEPGQCYQVRIASGNCKGYSEYCYPLMNQLIPSTWRSIDKRHSQMDKRIIQIDQLFGKIFDWRNQQQLKLMDPNNPSVAINSTHRKSVELDPAGGGGGGGGLPTVAEAASSSSSSMGSHHLSTANVTMSNTTGPQKKVRKSFKNFFGTTNKFQKIMKRSAVYFASLIYHHQQRILVTNEEVLPLIEIDDIYPSTLQNDFYWLLKISCAWNDVKMFRKEMEKCHQSSSATHFRIKILLAIEQMQSSLGLIDLGKLFYRPLRDNDGTVVLCSIRCLEDPKLISCLSVRWMSMAKLQKRAAQHHQHQYRDSSPVNLFPQPPQSSSSSPSSVMSVAELSSNTLAAPSAPLPLISQSLSTDMISGSSSSSSSMMMGDVLFSALGEMIHYHQACNRQLPPGLYVAYLRLKSSVDIMSLMVTRSHPNMLPYAKMRDNSHVSQKEWASIRMCLQPKSSGLNDLSPGGDQRRQSASPAHLHLQLCKPGTESTPDATITSLPSPMSVGVNFSEDLLKLALGQPPPPPHSPQRSTEPEPDPKSNQTQHFPKHLTFGEKLSFQQLLKFLQQLSQTSIHLLMKSIGIQEEKHLHSHRIYTVEVIELDSRVSLILLLPPPEEVCSVTQYEDINSTMDNMDLIYLPLKIFELIHMNTYQSRFTNQYWRISALLELDITAAQHAQREAFSSDEMAEAKTRLNQLLEFQQQLDEHCRSMRWIMDVVACARDKQQTTMAASISLAHLQHCLTTMDRQILEQEEEQQQQHQMDRKLMVTSKIATKFKNSESSGHNQHRIIDQQHPDHDVNDDGIKRIMATGHVPRINIQSECNSTPSSPPPKLTDDKSLDTDHHQSLSLKNHSSAGKRRKSRDDSYLDDQQRVRNHIQSLVHQRFHHNYHSCNDEDAVEQDDLCAGHVAIHLPGIQDQRAADQHQCSGQQQKQQCVQMESSYSLNDDLAKQNDDNLDICRSLSTSRLEWQPEPLTQTSSRAKDQPIEIHLKTGTKEIGDDSLAKSLIWQDSICSTTSSASKGLPMCFKDNFEDVLPYSQPCGSKQSSSFCNSECCEPMQQVRCESADPEWIKKYTGSVSVIKLFHQSRSKFRNKLIGDSEQKKQTRRCKQPQSYCEECLCPKSKSDSSSTGSSSCNISCCSSSSSCSSSPDPQGPRMLGTDPEDSIGSTMASKTSCSSSNNSIFSCKTIQINVIQKCCLPNGTVIEMRISDKVIVAQIIQAIIRYSMEQRINNNHKKQQQEPNGGSTPTSTTMIEHRKTKVKAKYQWENYSLLVIYSNNIKHLGGLFPIDQLQSPWNDAKICLQYHRGELDNVRPNFFGK